MGASSVVDASSKPALVVVTLTRGDQWLRTLRFRQGTSTGSPVDLTGAELSAAVYKTPGGVKEADVPISVTGDPTDGNATIDLNEELTSSLDSETFDGDPDGVHWILVRMTDSLLVTRTLLKIKLTVQPG